ncbi:hypothetical protein [Pseudoalteromonas denitrificans]|uniref:Tetratricopeptide repeat-containing protein n=1 Tax=Pseudoalteromonas denitrificans DSM 6059 TaxID=1123010 RepID=A0A1I1F4X2_9GAMM|nr:hypothetical protein [Pseudoalteromonas denitrificans]SFB92210.1 hypothetical protein SAMN02745724_00511 [Pseudoalteromonas denitrificans DSM 6059]
MIFNFDDEMLTASALFFTVINLSISSSPTVTFNALVKAEKDAANYPSLAINNYFNYKNQLNNLPKSIELRWHTAAIRAALNSSQLTFAEEIFSDMKHSYDMAVKHKIGFYYNLTGIWFRKSGYNQQALKAYQCALETTTNIAKQTKYLNNAAIAARYIKNTKLAKTYFSQAIMLLKKTPNKILEASISNNLGMLALSQNDFILAKKKFSHALYLKERVSRTASQLTTALNLLNTLIFMENISLSEKISLKIDKLFTKTSSTDKKIYYHWLQFSLDKLKNKHASISEKTLIQEFYFLKGSSYIALIEQRAAYLNIELPQPSHSTQAKKYKGPVLHYLKNCKLQN